MFGGVFERFPDQQFVLTETGSAWIPGELQRLDASIVMGATKTSSAYPLYHRAVENFKKLPSDWWRSNMHVGASLMQAPDIAARHALGVDRVMWGADYPHHEGSYPHNRLSMRLLFADVPQDEVRKIVSENAAKVYGFDLEALQKVADRIGPTVEEIAVPVRPDELPAASFSFTVGEAIRVMGQTAA
jgi:predicted TIM-barrel fold metal-dependent hydrolase